MDPGTVVMQLSERTGRRHAGACVAALGFQGQGARARVFQVPLESGFAHSGRAGYHCPARDHWSTTLQWLRPVTARPNGDPLVHEGSLVPRDCGAGGR